MPFERNFYKLCAGEVGIVLIGLVSIPASVVIQIFILLIVFRDQCVPPQAYKPALFVTVLALGTIFFSVLLQFFRHTFIPLLSLACFAGLSLFVVVFSESRIRRYARGIL
jgi:hypothetical protein